MKIYIAGKITGDPNFREKFAKAEKYLREKGHSPLNPALMEYGTEVTQEEYLHIDFAAIDVSDAIYFLKDWNESDGAKKENIYAMKHGKIRFFEFDEENQ